MGPDSEGSSMKVALVGPGRAGTALAVALVGAGHTVVAVAGRVPDAPGVVAAAEHLGALAAPVAEVARDADLVVLATPDDVVASVAEAVVPGLRRDALVVHCSGSLGLAALTPIAAARPDVRLGVLHPLQTLPAGDVGAARLPGSWAAVSGPSAVAALAEELGMQPFVVDDEHRDRYHAAACIASNHLVALLGQVERVASTAGVPLAAFEPLVRATVDNAFALGPHAALTGPVSRGDVDTVARHLAVVADDEQRAYRALAEAAARLAGVEPDHAMSQVLASGSPDGHPA
jgi:predicted short-subunit dehydrogenase-like oxidoreductase (DUF2520 family)